MRTEVKHQLGILKPTGLPLVPRKQKGVVIVQDGGAWARNKLTKIK